MLNYRSEYMRKEYRQRFAKEYRYAVNKMQEVSDPSKKLFYFSVLFSEAQRILNLEWDRDLVLLYTVTQHTHAQITASLSSSGVLPINWGVVFDKLTQVTSEIAAYYENGENDDIKEIYRVLGNLAEISYSVSGNGSYMVEKGIIKL